MMERNGMTQTADNYQEPPRLAHAMMPLLLLMMMMMMMLMARARALS